MSYPDAYTILERIKEKLDKHDKSIFTAFELNMLKDAVKFFRENQSFPKDNS